MDNLDKAKRYILNLLKYRARAICEIDKSLSSKGYDEQVILEAVDEFKKKGLLDDKKFVKDWVRERIEDYFYSFAFVREELRCKGIDNSLIEDALNDFAKEFSDSDTARKFIEKQMSKIEGLSKSKAKIKLASFLQRRGFETDLIEELLNQNES